MKYIFYSVFIVVGIIVSLGAAFRTVPIDYAIFLLGAYVAGDAYIKFLEKSK